MKKLFNRVMSMVLAMIMLLAMIPAVFATQEEWVDPIPAERIIYDIRADRIHLPIEISGDAIVNDPDSPFGKAARFSYEERSKSGEQYLLDAMRYIGDQAMKLRVYTTDPANDREVLVISQSQLRANSQMGKYLMYHVEDVDLFPNGNKHYLYMFDCWGLQVHFTEAERAAIQGQLVDVYMSLKVTGDFSVTEGNTVCYYIDRIVIATAEEGTEQHDHSLGEWKSANDYTHEAYCDIAGCGEVVSEDHTWGEGVVTKEPTKDEVGIETYTCSKCGATKTKKLAQTSGNASGKPSKDNGKNKGNNAATEINPVVWVAVGMFAVALIIIVLAVVMKKKGSKDNGENKEE